MCKQHFVEVSQEKQEKSVVPEIEIQSCVEPFAEVSKRTRLYTRVQRVPFNIESLHRTFKEKWQTQPDESRIFVQKLSWEHYLTRLKKVSNFPPFCFVCLSYNVTCALTPTTSFPGSQDPF